MFKTEESVFVMNKNANCLSFFSITDFSSFQGLHEEASFLKAPNIPLI